MTKAREWTILKVVRRIIAVIIILLFVGGLISVRRTTSAPKSPVKLYWFIPDGMRAEPDLFNIYAWAREGKLPNIKKLMDRGTYGYSYPNFPSHTPTNFATLLTGSMPEIHGVDDGPMREVGKPLDAVAVPGFRSTAKKVAPIWKTLEEAGMKVAILSVPGSTPPEIQKGVVIRGRWGGWGADFAPLNFETMGDLTQRKKQGRGTKLFFFGPQLTQYIDAVKPDGWENAPMSFSDAVEVTLTGWGTPVYAYIYDSTNDGKSSSDRVMFSLDKKTKLGDVAVGGWTDWQPISLTWKTADASVPVASHIKAGVIKLGDNGFYRIRLIYDALNKHITFPETAAETLEKSVGPMVDFADNFPAQLIYYPEDKKAFMDEAALSFDWHTKAVTSMVKDFSPDVVIHDIYTPNQMLTSKWWMSGVDPKSASYSSLSPADRQKLWNEVQDMYVKLDGMIGEILKVADANTYIVLSSDHGAVPLDRNVNLNNVFAKKGWLKFTIHPKTGEPIIDWARSQVIYLKMAHVYINPNGLAGKYTRATGSAYESLRTDVIDTLKNLKDENGVAPVVDVVKWEDAKSYMQLDPDRIGDLVIANTPGYGWNEEMTADLAPFSVPIVAGYKQAIKAVDVPGMWTPFIMSGPGIKKNNFLGNKPFSLIQQYPTIMKALKVAMPSFVQGKPLDIFTR